MGKSSRYNMLVVNGGVCSFIHRFIHSFIHSFIHPSLVVKKLLCLCEICLSNKETKILEVVNLFKRFHKPYLIFCWLDEDFIITI
jgi:hypothetical protein